MGRILVVGSLNMDLVVHSPKVPAIGETLTGFGFMTCPGGKGGNQAVAAARLGAEVRMLGCVGEDDFGETLLRGLEENGVDTRWVRRVPGVPTGTATIVVVEGDNCIVVDRGANDHVTPELVEAAAESFRWAERLLVQLEIPMETVEAALKMALRHGLPVVLDPAPATPLPEWMLSMVEVFKPNEHECLVTTGLPADSPADAAETVRALRQRGVHRPMVTLGKEGVVYWSEEQGTAVHVPAYPAASVVDTTAAGDSFSGALSVALTDGCPLDAAIRFASRVAAIVVSRPGAQPSLPWRRELEPEEGLPTAAEKERSRP